MTGKEWIANAFAIIIVLITAFGFNGMINQLDDRLYGEKAY